MSWSNRGRRSIAGDSSQQFFDNAVLPFNVDTMLHQGPEKSPNFKTLSGAKLELGAPVRKKHMGNPEPRNDFVYEIPSQLEGRHGREGV